MLYLPKPRMEERQMLYSLEGMWKADLGDGCRYDMKLPGTLETEHHKKAGRKSPGRRRAGSPLSRNRRCPSA